MRDSPISAENAKAGTLHWQAQFTRFDDPRTLVACPLIRQLRSSRVEGYVSKTSVARGEALDLFVSLNPAGRFRLDVYRMGWYGGTGGRHVGSFGPFAAEPQPMPPETVERLRECRWAKAATLTIPAEWPSGVYLGKLTRDEPFGAQSYVVFVVKERRPCELLCMASDLTWQAYNKWPGTSSLYDDGTPELWYQGTDVRVSFDRPYAKYCQVLDAPLSGGSGEFLLWEHPLCFWLEQQGYDVTYCSNLDLELDPGLLAGAKALLSVGHDEYWSYAMYENVLRARDAGLSVAFLGGNSLYHRVEFHASSATGAPCRAFARERRFDDEDRLMGVKSFGPGYGDWVVTNAKHWLYAGTGLADGERIPAIVGWEYHGAPAALEGLEVVADGRLWAAGSDATADDPSAPLRHQAVIYPGPKGNWVFNAGTIWWSEGLAAPPGHIPARWNLAGTFGPMPEVQRITKNVLDRMIADGRR
ncbi:MAG: hypothetical protein M5U26_10105 [Planctomycetota bacterium]|nr:hypothetical protein [Planctomycetota bacterium]